MQFPSNVQPTFQATPNQITTPDGDFQNLIQENGPNDFKAEIEVPENLRSDPSLNFVGMMIGPGGSTQRQMESSTGCNITVRGAGSTRNNIPLDPERNMYVMIKSNFRENVAKAVAIIYGLLFDKTKRDALRSQQLAMRHSQMASQQQFGIMNPQMPFYGQPVMQTPFYNRNQSNSAQLPRGYLGMAPSSYKSNSSPNMMMNSPFQNAFKRTELGDGQILESIVIPVGKLPLISGPNGAAEGVSYYSGAKIETKEFPGNPTFAKLCIEGSANQIAMARHKLQEAMESDPADPSSQIPPTDHVMVPNTVVGLIIGKNGETIKKFMADTQCRMKIVPEYLTNPDDIERKLLLFGNPKQCSDAKFVVNDLVAKHKTTNYSASGSSQTRVEIVSVPCGCVGILIGRGGDTIRSMCMRTNCRVQVVQYDENQLFPGGVILNQNLRHVSLRGDDSSIKKAKIEIQAIVNEHANRNNYAPPNLNEDGGDPHLGLSPEQYEKYLQQMKSSYGMEKSQVHEYYHSVMSQIAKEPVDYAAAVKQYQGAQKAYGQMAMYNANTSQQQGQNAMYGNGYGGTQSGLYGNQGGGMYAPGGNSGGI